MEEPARSPETSPARPAGSGLDENVAGALSYLLGVLTGILFLLIDKDRPFVRFHAMQSIVLSVAWFALWVVITVVGAVLGAVPILGWILNGLLVAALSLGGLILWLYVMYRAFQGEEWEIPVIGEQARSFVPAVRDG